MKSIFSISLDSPPPRNRAYRLQLKISIQSIQLDSKWKSEPCQGMAYLERHLSPSQLEAELQHFVYIWRMPFCQHMTKFLNPECADPWPLKSYL